MKTQLASLRKEQGENRKDAVWNTDTYVCASMKTNTSSLLNPSIHKHYKAWTQQVMAEGPDVHKDKKTKKCPQADLIFRKDRADVQCARLVCSY